MIIRSKLIPVAALGFIAAWPAVVAAAGSIQADIPYVTSATGETLRLDLYLPESAGAPLLVWIHGGAWERFDKSSMPVASLVDRGFAMAVLDFRPASKAQFPGQVHEIKAVIRFLRAEASRYGYDASRIGILGASSGAHLAAVVGTSNGNAELEGALGD